MRRVVSFSCALGRFLNVDCIFYCLVVEAITSSTEESNFESLLTNVCVIPVSVTEFFIQSDFWIIYCASANTGAGMTAAFIPASVLLKVFI